MCGADGIPDILAHLAFFFTTAGFIFAHLADRPCPAAVMGFMGAIIASVFAIAPSDFIWGNNGHGTVATSARAIEA